MWNTAGIAATEYTHRSRRRDEKEKNMHYFRYLINFLWLGLLVCMQGATMVYAQTVESSSFVTCAGGQAVCDLKTGLMWEVKVAGGGQPA